MPLDTKYVALSVSGTPMAPKDLAENNNDKTTCFIVGMVARSDPSKLKSNFK
jgi:rRNA pseudouridine-1189 N-methylase Emg1 (Nep1/Mra1 family)